jgi:hypothetical protein
MGQRLEHNRDDIENINKDIEYQQHNSHHSERLDVPVRQHLHAQRVPEKKDQTVARDDQEARKLDEKHTRDFRRLRSRDSSERQRNNVTADFQKEDGRERVTRTAVQFRQIRKLLMITKHRNDRVQKDAQEEHNQDQKEDRPSARESAVVREASQHRHRKFMAA